MSTGGTGGGPGGGGPGGGRGGGPGGGRGRGGGPGGGRGRGGRGGRDSRAEGPEQVVQIRRCSCVVKGGRRFSFSALVVVGDKNGRVGWGYGKATEVPVAVEKAVKNADRNMTDVPLEGRTIPHQVVGRYGAAKVLLLPASPGTGIIAGETVRAVVDSLGVADILTKSRGSNNPINLVKATFDGLKRLRTRETVSRLRGVELS
ncbi:MAG TPA: 30S ribosomal protein S5 [Planctomycetaceae bacterium]|nr:30S ribosomal protein S5 [Planctomycetaceae bacterium]